MRMAIEINEKMVKAKYVARQVFIAINYSPEGFRKMVEIYNRTAPQTTALISGIIRAERDKS